MQNRIKIKDIYIHPWVKTFEKQLINDTYENESKELIANTRNNVVTINKDRNSLKSDPSSYLKFGISLSKNKVIKPDIIGKSNQRKANEQSTKNKTDINSRESTNLFDKVLDKVDKKSKGKYIDHNQTLGNELNRKTKKFSDRLQELNTIHSTKDGKNIIDIKNITLDKPYLKNSPDPNFKIYPVNNLKILNEKSNSDFSDLKQEKSTNLSKIIMK